MPVIEAFHARGELGQVICQVNTGFSVPGTSSAAPIAIHYFLRALERFFHISVSRQSANALFDRFASWRMRPAQAWLLHPGNALPRSLERARRLGAISINIATTAHLRTNAALEKEELAALGCAAYEGVYENLDRQLTHANEFDYVIALSEFVKDSYVQAGFPSDRIFVAPTDSADLSTFSPDAQGAQGTFRLLYIGYTTPLKGLQYLLDAWGKLHLPDAELVLVGGYGDMPAEVKERFDALIAKDPSIRWTGSTRDPQQYYREASAFAFPSLTEGCPRVVLEAMASGLPVITTENAPSIVEDGKTGFIVPIRDAGALMQRILYLYTNRDIGRAMGKEARTAIERKQSFGEAVFEIYQEILKRESANA